jgi:hypothetical protein
VTSAPERVPLIVGRDASTVLDFKEFARYFRRSPNESVKGGSQTEAIGITHFADPTEDEDDGLTREPLTKRSKVSTEENEETKGSLDGIKQDTREQKATKVDDADVSKFLWYEHLCDDGERSWTEAEKQQLPAAANTLRAGMLRFWKRKVTTSFVRWVKKKHPGLKKIDQKWRGAV